MPMQPSEVPGLPGPDYWDVRVLERLAPGEGTDLCRIAEPRPRPFALADLVPVVAALSADDVTLIAVAFEDAVLLLCGDPACTSIALSPAEARLLADSLRRRADRAEEFAAGIDEAAARAAGPAAGKEDAHE